MLERRHEANELRDDGQDDEGDDDHGGHAEDPQVRDEAAGQAAHQVQASDDAEQQSRPGLRDAVLAGQGREVVQGDVDERRGRGVEQQQAE